MSRYISFTVLIFVILFLGIVFFRVMASFILPLFLASVLVVVFAPVHKWVLEKTGNRKTLASAITTAIISLAVIVPAGGIGVFAFGEARQLFKNLTAGGMEQNLKRIRKSLRLEMPAPAEIRQLDKSVRALDVRNLEELDLGAKQLNQIADHAERLELELRIPRFGLEDPTQVEEPLISSEEMAYWNRFRTSLRNARELQAWLTRLQTMEPASPTDQSSTNPTSELEKNEPTGFATAKGGNSQSARQSDQLIASETNYKKAMEAIVTEFDAFRMNVLGGSVLAYFKELANPSAEEFEKNNAAVIFWIRENFLSVGGRATQFLFGVVFHAVIMMIGVYFFLVDGPRMLAALKFFSPMDDSHEDELIVEFGVVSRAVMVATLSAAIVQGLLAGIGYYFAGVQAVFLLTLLTGVLAMVPFLGATAVWLPTCLYLYLMEDRLVPAALLAVWGAGIVSTVDNFIKPFILHGQSNIHPLLALLSVLGGVATLGPIGILVGPMVVAFLQTLLTILQREISTFDQPGSERGNLEEKNSNLPSENEPTSPEFSVPKPSSELVNQVTGGGSGQRTSSTIEQERQVEGDAATEQEKKE